MRSARSVQDLRKRSTGSDRALELDLLIEKLTELGPRADMQALPGLLTEEDKNYFDMYVDQKRLEMEGEEEGGDPPLEKGPDE